MSGTRRVASGASTDRATEGLLRRPKLRGEHVQVWVGHAVYLLALVRPVMSILDATYRLIAAAWGRRTVVWREVMQDMRDVRAMVCGLGRAVHPEGGRRRRVCLRVRRLRS